MEAEEQKEKKEGKLFFLFFFSMTIFCSQFLYNMRSDDWLLYKDFDVAAHSKKYFCF